MKNSIAIAAALGVVAFFFGQDLFPAFAGEPERTPKRDSASLISMSSGLFTPPSLGGASFPTLGSGAIRDRAWSVFEQYREFAKNNNLEGVKSLSHQVSDTCLDPERREECNTLMQSVYLFTENWQKEEFPNVAYDDRQIVLSTDWGQVEEGGDKVKVVILLTRTPSGEPRMLGIKFCAGEENPSVEKCVDTDPATRDQDGDAWWDDIEERFYR